MRNILSILILFCLLNSCRNHQEVFVIQNDVFQKTIGFSKEKPDKISVELNFSEEKNSISEKDHPYFEFVIKNQLVSSNDKLWIFTNHSEREMGNGGTEHILTFEGIKEPVKGLQVVLFQQVFPNSTLMREKLELKAAGNTFTLNKLEGTLHFKFPCYSVKNRNGQKVECTEIRMASFEKKPITFGNDKGNHMFYPDIIQTEVSENKQLAKGPVSIVTNGEKSWFTAYEHASQDDLNGMFDKQKLGEGNLINDAMQGTKGVFNFSILEEDFKFLGISSQLVEKDIQISVEILRGGYLDGEIIDKDHSYSTVWTATGFYDGSNLEEGKMMLRNYLFNQICEKPASRKPEYYYNTWGMQRNDNTKPLRDILTYERIFKEIDFAAELGVDIFVLDDGWENAQGDWFPNKTRLPEGLAPIKTHLDKYGIKMGLWYSPMGIDSTTQRYKDHPEWVIKDSEGNPISAQWEHPAFDFVSGFFDLFVDDCKQMIDEGCRFMKWDAINTFYSSLANLHHGSDRYSKEELRARYEYLLPIYVTRAMEILTNYEPELVIEVDLTEARRVMAGLAPLSQGKLFWMNNGASWYNDYTTYRSKSMRTIASEFAGIIPLELFTYANYPHNITGNMKYNVHNSLLTGHGFWGNLELMSAEERQWIGKQVNQSKKVLPYLVDVNPEVIGKVGDSPEIYLMVNREEAAGQVIAFTENPVEKEIDVEVDPEKMLVALNYSYSINDSLLNVDLKLKEKESSVAIIILPNLNSGISIISSTSEIIDAELLDNKLNYLVSTPGEQIIIWKKKNGNPTVVENNDFKYDILEKETDFQITIQTEKNETEILIAGNRDNQ
jgi:hypothetical protein